MEPRLVTLPGNKLVGVRDRMSLAEDRTRGLWQRFMPCLNEVGNRIGRGYISMQLYDRPPDQGFGPETPFEKWAAVEVADLEAVPVGMEGYAVPAGDYAVFLHVGPASTFARTVHHVFRVWLPASSHVLDHRPHLTLMQEHYRPDDPQGEEEIWVPVCRRGACASVVAGASA